MIVIVTKPEKILPVFLEYMLNTNKLVGNGVNIPQLTVPMVFGHKIQIPPLETQKQIVSKIEVMESKISEAKKVIDGAKEQKDSILRKYL